ncbi:MAG: hypothetical protein QXP70_04270 [Methanomassiliicoccales archaeon]
MPRRIEELKRAEEKYHALLDKRDRLNSEAAEIRKVRDMLNEQRKTLFSSIIDIRKSVSEKVTELNKHKNARNEFNSKARELIQLKRQLYKSYPDSDVFREIEKLNREFETLELKQQTESMSLQEENEVISRMRSILSERSEMMKLSKKTEAIAGQLSDINAKIDEYFQNARREHEMVMSIHAELQQLREEMEKKIQEASIITGEADHKHKEYIEKKGEADAAHAQAMEMRSLILEIRKERKEAFLEGKRAIQEHNASALKLLEDRHASEEEADRQLQELLKKGKISLR